MIFDYVIFSAVSFLVAYLWLSYLKVVDVFQPDSWGRIGFSFFVGCFSVLPVFALSHFFGHIFTLDSNPSSIFLFHVFDVGMVEEFSKLALAFFVIHFFIRPQEPVDYLVHTAAVAAGFAAIENILYVGEYGVEVLRGRAPKSGFMHMAYTSVPVYFYVIYKIKFPNGFQRYLALGGGFVLGAFIHGFSNFLLSINGFFIIAFLVYFVMVEVWLTQINNLLNLSPHFDKTKVPQFKPMQKRLFIGFIGLAVFEIISFIFIENREFSLLTYLFKFIFLTVLPILLIMSKFSNLRLIPGKLFPLFFQFTSILKVKTFQTNRTGSAGFSSALHDLRIDSVAEQEITTWLFSKVRLRERGAKSGLPTSVSGILSDKFWISEDEVFFGFEPLETFHIEGFRPDLWLLKAKTDGETKFEGHPEILVFLIPEGKEIHRNSKLGDFVPRARCYMQNIQD